MIRVEGHTDQTGSEQYNLQLSERRANAAKNALIQKGVDPARVSAIGMGMCCPVSSDNAANRRVSMVLTGQVYQFLKAVFGKKQYGHSSGGASP